MLIQIVLNYLVFELSFRREYQKYVKGKEYVEGFKERESTEKREGSSCVCLFVCVCEYGSLFCSGREDLL